MQLNLLENAMDSLSEAIDYYVDGKAYADERCYKFCVIMLYHSAELILKEILVREHKTLIYEQIDDYKNGKGTKTIGLRVALMRVRNICDIDLLKYHGALVNLADTRNKIQHYEVNEETEVLIATIISAFSAIEHLVYHALNERFENFDSIIAPEQITTLHEDKEAYIKRKKDISDDICSQNLSKVSFSYSANKNISIPCPKCAETFLIQAKNHTIKCYYCGTQYQNLQEIYLKDKNCIVSDTMERELGKRKSVLKELLECPGCNYKTLIYDESDSTWKCAACGKTFDNHTIQDYISEREYEICYQGREDWEADLADAMEDPHNSHLW